MIRLTYDRSVDALMIELVPEAESARTVRVTDTVRTDLDARGAVIGVEILDAAAQLGRDAVEQLPTGARWLTLEPAAKESGRAASTLRVQLNAGRLKGEKRGRDWCVEEHELLTYQEPAGPSAGERSGAAGGVGEQAGGGFSEAGCEERAGRSTARG